MNEIRVTIDWDNNWYYAKVEGYDIETKAYTLKEIKKRVNNELQEWGAEGECKYTLTLAAFLNGYKDIIFQQGIENRSGVCHKRLWMYMHKRHRIRQDAFDVLAASINELGKELSEMTLIR